MELATHLHQHLTEIVRERDPYLATEGHFYVREYVAAQLAAWGTVERHDFTLGGQTYQNLILNLPARDPQTRRSPILLGAHYDAVPNTPGADDNASGVAVLLELARLFAAEPARHPIRLVAFDLEELGMVGSTAYAQLLREQGVQLRLMLSLEMLGYCTEAPHSQQYPVAALKRIYPDRGNFVGLIGNPATLPDLMRLQRAIARAGVPARWLPVVQQGRPIPATRLSDHAPFWDRGYPALMVTDTAFMRNPHYHTPDDRLDTLDLDFMAGICAGLAQGVRSL